MKIRLAAPVQSDSIVDGEGIRSVIWTQGCSHNCPGCHNPETHDFKAGFDIDVADLKKEIANLSGQDGITFSGGDPMFQPKECASLAKYAKSLGLNIWCYTGFTFEQLVSSKKEDIMEFLNYIDVLVDGKFILEEKSLECTFRGSKNQRVLDVKKSLEDGNAVEIEKYKVTKEEIFNKESYLFI